MIDEWDNVAYAITGTPWYTSTNSKIARTLRAVYADDRKNLPELLDRVGQVVSPRPVDEGDR